MLETLPSVQADPILRRMMEARADPRQDKIDLVVGVYQDEFGQVAKLEVVKQAEQRWLAQENTKSYVGWPGWTSYLDGLASLIMQKPQWPSRFSVLQTTGGCGALRIGAELIAHTQPNQPKQQLWLSDPTWANHYPLLQAAQLRVSHYRYDTGKGRVDFAAMMEDLQRANPQDVILLHACCHNPTGMDLTHDQWQQIADLCDKNQLIPFVDMAYQGLADDLTDDAWPVRLLSQRLPEMLVAISSAKNMALYRERVGALAVMSQRSQQAQRVSQHMAAIARALYSMPPSYGAAVAGLIMQCPELKHQWQREVTAMRQRLQDLRQQLAHQAQRYGLPFLEVANQHGLFCRLNITPCQVAGLRDRGVYTLDDGRINISALSEQTIAIFVNHLHQVIHQSP